MAEKSRFHVDAGSRNLPLDWQSYNVIQSTKKVTETTFVGLYRSEKLATRNENTAVNQQEKVGRKLRLQLWDQACKKSMELRVNVKKGAVMIVHVHVLSFWLASSYPIRCTFPQQNSWRVSVESAINNQRVLAISHEGMARWPHGCLFILQIRQRYWTWKAFLSITTIIKGEKETCQISEIARIIFSLKFIGSFEAATFSFTNLFFSPNHFSLLSGGRSLCCLPHFAPTVSRTKRAAKIFSPLWAQYTRHGSHSPWKWFSPWKLLEFEEAVLEFYEKVLEYLRTQQNKFSLTSKDWKDCVDI